MFRPNALYFVDGYKIGHKAMLADNTRLLYGTWIPRTIKHAPDGVKKIVSFGQQYVVKRLHDIFKADFFDRPIEEAVKFGVDMSKYLGLDYDASHFSELHKLGYLPYRIKALPEGMRTNPNIPHMTFVNTLKGRREEFAWLTLYLETFISFTSWKLSTSATLAFEFKKNAIYWTKKTDPSRLFLADYMCHDFSARGLSESDSITSGLGHITSHRGTDSIITIPASRYYYGVGEDEMPVNSVNASEHSVSTTKIFTVGEKQMIHDWMIKFPMGIFSMVSDTMDIWKLITEFLAELKDVIMLRDGKLVIRPDSGNPVKILCGEYYPLSKQQEAEWLEALNNGHREAHELFKEIYDKLGYKGLVTTEGEYFDIVTELGGQELDGYFPEKKDPATLTPADKGVITLLWEIFGGTTNELGYKIFDSHIGAIYGDSINLQRQVEIYTQLERKGFAATNVVLGIGSFTYQFNTRDTFGWAAKGSYFEVQGETEVEAYDIYKDPITDDGSKRSLKGLLKVYRPEGSHGYGDAQVKQQCTWEEEAEGLLQTIYENGEFHNETTLEKVRQAIEVEIQRDLVSMS